MPIKIRCSNQECGKTLLLKDEAAGKRVRCPACETICRVPMPEPEVDDLDEIEEVDDLDEVDEPPRRKKSAKAAPHKRQRPEPEEEEDRPRRRRRSRDEEEEDRPRRRARAEKDFDEEDFEEEEDAPKRGKKKKGFDSLAKIYFASGVGLLAACMIIPFLPWYTFSLSSPEGQPEAYFKTSVNGMSSLSVAAKLRTITLEDSEPLESGGPKGLIWLILCGLLLLGLGGCLGLALVKDATDPLTEKVATWAGLIGSGAGLAFLAWMLAWIWKVSTVSQAELGSFEIGGGTGGTFPGFGLFVGVGLSIGVTFVFSNLALRLTKKKWTHLAEAVGLLVGCIILAALVQPWSEKEFTENFGKTLEVISKRNQPAQ